LSKALLKALLPAALAMASPVHAREESAITIALGGDMIGPYRSISGLSDPGFDAVRALFRGADLGYANQEGSIFDLETFDGFPAPENGGGYPRMARASVAELRDMGIGLVSKANNHATDWGAHGLVATLRSLDEEGMAHAGAGADPAAACAPGYRDKVALVSAATTFPPMSLPTAPVNRRGAVSRAGPGICAIHVAAIREVSEAQLAALREIAGPLALNAGPDGREVRIADQRFRAAPQPGLTWEMKSEDLAPVMASIGAADAKASAVIFAVHAHETAGTVDDMPPRDFEPLLLHHANEAPGANDAIPADFVPLLMHGAIDAGADIALRTGPHQLSGIEIYKGKPIFYGLASLVFDFGGRRGYTAAAGQSIVFPPEWFETVVPVVTLRRGRVSEVRLYPAMIDPDAGPGGGLPHLAKGADAARILSRLQALSQPYGTNIRVKDDLGVIRPAVEGER